MKIYINKLYLLCLTLFLVIMSGCDNEDKSNLSLNGDAFINKIVLDDQYEGVIDNKTATITVGVPYSYNTDAMTVSQLELSEGAQATIKIGDKVNFSFPQSVKVTNGDAFFDYTISVKHDEAKILSFKLNGYAGSINQDNRTISVRIPTTESITSLTASIEMNEGTTVVSPANYTTLDYSSPVEFVVENNTARITYTVVVTQSDAAEVIYVGLAENVDALNPEEKEAVNWILRNVSGAQYASFNDISRGVVDLSECKVMWWHLHIDGGIDNMEKFDQNAVSSLTAIQTIKDFYEAGGSLLLTRFATYYAVKLGATLDGNNPNNCWGQVEESGEITTGPWSFFIESNSDHALFQNLIMNSGENDKVYTCDAGYRITNSTAQWHIGSDWGGYPTQGDWETKHGGKALGFGGDGSIVAWEYLPNNGRGGIVCIGSGCYDWYAHGVDVSADKYHGNVAKMTENAINYLKGE